MASDLHLNLGTATAAALDGLQIVPLSCQTSSKPQRQHGYECSGVLLQCDE